MTIGRPIRALVASLVFVVVAASAGVWLLVAAGGGLHRDHVVASGVPLDEVHPAGGGRRPGVVVAHGFAGSARLMAPFGDTLAARGYVVVLLDFAGHGANAHPLRNTDADLQGDLDVALAHLRSLPDVDPARIALVGHSMGAGAVTEYAAGHPEVKATVALSLPSADDATFRNPAAPTRLLLMVGSLEFADFRTAAEAAKAAGGPDRSAVVIPGVEHISILFAPRTHRDMVTWLDDSFGGSPTPGPIPSPTRRVLGAGLLLAAFGVGFYPLARLLLGRGGRGRPPITLPTVGRIVLVTLIASAIAAAVAPILPTIRLPLSIGGYLVGFTVIMGTVLWAYDIAYERRRHTPQPAPPGRRGTLAAPLLVGYAAVAVALPLQLGVTHTIPVGARWWLLPIVWAGFAVLSYAAERLARGNPFVLLTIFAVLVAALTGAAVAGLTNGFVLLVVPLLGVLLLWQTAWSAVLRRFATPPWVIAVAGSLLVAWPIATTLPVIG